MLFVFRSKILHNHCLQFLLGVNMASRETENNAYAKFWGDKQRALWYVMVFLEWSIGQLANRVAVWRQSEVSIDLYESFRAWSFFNLSVLLTNQNPRAFVFVREPIFMIPLHFRSFFVSVLIARFHFKVIRKSHLCWALLLYYNCLIERFHSRGQQLCNFIYFALEKVPLVQDCFRTPTWPTCYCFQTPIWRTWRHVKHSITSIFLSPSQIS